MAESNRQIGRVRSVNPARRELRVTPLPGSAHVFERLEGWVTCARADGAEMRLRLLESKTRDGDVRLRLAPGVTRDTVGGLRGAAVLWDQPMPPAEDGAFEPAALAGMAVETPDGRRLGVVTDTFETAANAALRVRREDGGTVLLPVAGALIREVDWSDRVIRVRDIAPFAVEEE